MRISLSLLLFIISAVSCQRIPVHSKNSTNITRTNLNTSSVSQEYIDGCKAVLQAKDAIYESVDSWKTTWSTWENKSPYGSLMDFFDNDNGIVSKTWVQDGYWSTSWIFNLTFYDGNYIDKKFAMVQFEIDNIDSSDFDSNSGTFSTQDVYVYVSYGENNEAQYTHSALQGRVSLYFFNTNTQQTITYFSNDSDNIEGDTVEITFASNGSLLSFKTFFFNDSYSISDEELITVGAWTLIYVIWSLVSAGTFELRRKVSLTYVTFAYASSAYIALWIFIHIPDRDNLLLMIPLFGALVDWIKQAIFIVKKNRTTCGLIIVMTIFAFVLNFVPSIWVNLFPAVSFVIPFFVKLASEHNQHQYLNMFHVSNWICMSVWMVYFYFYPTNIFLNSPQPLLFMVFLGIIFVLFIISFLMEKSQRRRQQYVPLLFEDNEAQRSQLQQPLVAAAAVVQRPQRRPQAQANPNREKKPRRKLFKYTFAGQGGAQEDYTLLTDECAICFDYLLGENAEKLYKTPCGHMFHEGCLRAWGVKKLECPCCRKKLPKFKRQPAN